MNLKNVINNLTLNKRAFFYRAPTTAPDGKYDLKINFGGDKPECTRFHFAYKCPISSPNVELKSSQAIVDKILDKIGPKVSNSVLSMYGRRSRGLRPVFEKILFSISCVSISLKKL